MADTLRTLEESERLAALRARVARVERLAAQLAGEVSDLLAQVVAIGDRPSLETPALLSVEDAARALGLSRTTTFALVRDGELASLKVGSRRLVPRDSIQAFVARQVDRGSPKAS